MKKFIASFISFVMFILLSSTCTIYIARELMGEKTISAIIDIVQQEYQKEYGTEVFTTILTAPLAEINPKIPSYFSEEEFEQELNKIVVNFFSNLGNPEKEQLIDTTNLKNIYYKNVDKFEEATGETIPDAIIDDMLRIINEQYNLNKKSFGEGIIVFEIIYSEKIFTYLITGISICILLMFILLSNLKDTLLKIKSSIIANGIGALSIGYIISSMLYTAEKDHNGVLFIQKISNILIKPFLKVGITSIAIGVLLIIIANILKHNKSIENSNKDLENLGKQNYTPQSISNTPYIGYQNH